MSSKTVAKRYERHRWALEFSSRGKGDTGQEGLSSPCGYTTEKHQNLQTAGREADPKLIVKKSWDIALGPFKQVPMNLFIMWMAGSSISIFPIMMVGMMFMRPVQALLSVQQTFKMIEGNHAVVQRIVYFLGNVVGLALAVYKCQVMGLLPTHPSDWLAFVEPQSRLEWSGGGVTL